MQTRRRIPISQMCALLLVLAAGCSTLTPRGEVREEFMQDVVFTLDHDGVALFGGMPPSIDELRSCRNPELIRHLVAKLDGPESVAAETLLSALAALEGERLVPILCGAFDQVTESLAVDDLNLTLMKAARLRSVTIPMPETGYTVQYELILTDTGYGYSQTESGDGSGGKPVSEDERKRIFLKRSQQYWNERL